MSPPAAPLHAGLLWASAGDTARARKLQVAAEIELNEEENNVMEPGVECQDVQGQTKKGTEVAKTTRGPSRTEQVTATAANSVSDYKVPPSTQC